MLSPEANDTVVCILSLLKDLRTSKNRFIGQLIMTRLVVAHSESFDTSDAATKGCLYDLGIVTQLVSILEELAIDLASDASLELGVAVVRLMS